MTMCMYSGVPQLLSWDDNVYVFRGATAIELG